MKENKKLVLKVPNQVSLTGLSLPPPGSSSGGVVSGHQPQRGPRGDCVPRQVPASVGEDQGARHPGGGARDGEEGGAGAGGTPTEGFPL